MVENFIHDLCNIYDELSNEDKAIGTKEDFILSFGLLKLIDCATEFSKEDVRQEYLKIKNNYCDEGNLFFELYPEYQNRENFNEMDLSSADLEIYKSITTDDGLNISSEGLCRLDTGRVKHLQDALNNSKFYGRLYKKSKLLNGDNLNFFNVSSYNLKNFANRLIEFSNKFDNNHQFFNSQQNQHYLEFEQIIEDYLMGFDISTRLIYTRLYPMFIDLIFLSQSFDVFQKVDEIVLNPEIFKSKNNLLQFLSLFIVKLFKNTENNFLLDLAINNNEFGNKSYYNILIQKTNDFNFIINLINKLSSFDINFKIFLNHVENFTVKEILLKSLITEVIDIQKIDNKFLDDIDLIISNTDFVNLKILDYFKNKNIPPIKLISPVNYLDCTYEIFNKIINNDYLESIILLNDKSPVMVLNSDKIKEKSDKFLLIDEIDNYLSKNIYNRVFKSYNLFNEYKNSKLIFNKNINNNSFKNHFNLNNLMYDKFKKVHDVKYDETTSKFSFDNENIEITCLGEIVNLNVNDVDFNVVENTLYVNNSFKNFDSLCLIPNMTNNWVFSSERIVKTNKTYSNHMNLITAELITQKVLKEYLFYYLNSNKGIEELNFLKRHKDTNYLNDLKYIRIPVPDIETQKHIIETARNMDNFFTNIEIFKNDFYKNILNYEPTLKALNEFSCQIEFSDAGSVSNLCSNWRIVYQGILWPLAITYLFATKKSNSYQNKKEQYIKLFEFFAAFNVIILISAIPEELKDEFFMEVFNGFKGLNNITFGNWTYLYKKLSKFYSTHEFDTVIDKSILKEIASKKYTNLFFKLRPKRNKYKGHDSMILEDNDENLVKAVEELELYMNNEIFEIMKCYSGLKLYYTTGNNNENRIDGIIKQELLILNGPCNPQFYYEITLNIEDKLDSNYLYLFDSSKNSFLKVNDSFMKLYQKDSKEWLLYLFDGYNSDNESKYKCHQKYGESQVFKDDLFLNELKFFVGKDHK